MQSQNNLSKGQAWLAAFRLRTLPLAVSSILLGYFFAYNAQKSNVYILLLSISTTILLQILSNLANDYGDAVHGADNEERVGPLRMVQSGAISKESMQMAIISFAILAFISGISLLVVSFNEVSIKFIVFLLVGIAAIGAAIKYTAGNNPYGYSGLGDLSVLVFFGFVGVFGSYFLQTKTIDLPILLPALASGLLATAVLNINNLRDIQTDRKVGKKSIPVRLGYNNGRLYHVGIISIAVLSFALYNLFFLNLGIKNFIFVPFLILVLLHTRNVWVNGQTSKLMNKYLKQMALLSLFFSLSYGFAILS